MIFELLERDFYVDGTDVEIIKNGVDVEIWSHVNIPQTTQQSPTP